MFSSLLLLPLIISLAQKKENTTVQTTMETTGSLETTTTIPDLLQGWLELERRLNKTAVEIDLRRAWVTQAIQKKKKKDEKEAYKKLNNYNHS